MTVIGPSPSKFVPNVSVFQYTDHSGVSVDTARARFLRPGNSRTAQHAAPGSRVRFKTNSPILTIHLYLNNLQTASEYDNTISVIVNGVATDYEPDTSRTAFAYDIALNVAASRARMVEIIFPYGAGLDFLGVTIDPAYGFLPIKARPTEKILVVGDSVSQGYYSTKSMNVYPFKLAALQKKQCVNCGLSGAVSSTFGNGSGFNGINPAKGVVMLGVNDLVAQVALATFKSNLTSLINGLLAGSSCDWWISSMLWTSQTGTITAAQYRTATSEAVAAIANARLHYVDGLSLCTNSTVHIPDGVHTNDAGNDAVASALNVLLN